MDGGIDFVAGLIFGFIFSVLLTTGVSHLGESSCQQENNVADCEWVLVPVVPK